MAAPNDYQVTFTLNGLYTGTTEADNFTIIGKHCNGSPADTTIATGVTASDLTTGITYTIAATISGGTITSTGDCTNSVPWAGLVCEGGEPPTPTPTATSEPAGGNVFTVSRCNDDQLYNLADYVSCIEGQPAIPPNPSIYTVGQYVQFTTGTSCNAEQTSYCGIITAVNVVGEADAVLIRHELLNQAKGCTNVECAE